MHSAITPVVVAPGQPHVLPYVPEFITPQDGAEKQDCEINAAKRWVEREATTLRQHRAILLGDDLYSRQPLCETALRNGTDFIFVCHQESHPALYAVVDTVANLGRLASFSQRQWNGRHGEIWTYRFLNDLPLRAGGDALPVNWCDLQIVHEETGEILYRNEWITSLRLEQENVSEIVACGRARWKSEMDTLIPGDVLEVLSTDRTSQRELRDWTERSGNTLLESSSGGGPFWAREYRYLSAKCKGRRCFRLARPFVVLALSRLCRRAAGAGIDRQQAPQIGLRAERRPPFTARIADLSMEQAVLIP